MSRAAKKSQIEDLREAIEREKSELTFLVQRLGFGHPLVLKMSQEIDVLIVRYLQMSRTKP